MRIAIDIESLRFEKTGLTQYTYQLLDALMRTDSENEYVLLNRSFKKGRTRQPVLPPQLSPRTTVKNIKVSRKILNALWNSVGFPDFERLCGGFDVYHSPSHTDFPFSKRAKVATVHDLTILQEGFHDAGIEELKIRFRKICNTADMIIADSISTRNDIVEAFDIPPEKIRVVYIAASGNFSRIDDLEEIQKVLDKFNIDNEYILYLGTLEPRKNVDGLIRAYDEFRKCCPAEKPLLVLAGSKGWLYEKIFNAAEQSPFKEDIRFTGFVPDEDVSHLVSGAKIFAYPSFYEGFGLPVLEAMACGAPVITGNKSSLPEVAGDAALMVDPVNTEEIAGAIQKIVEDNNFRESLINRGYERVKTFSWKKCAAETLAVYREAYKISEKRN